MTGKHVSGTPLTVETKDLKSLQSRLPLLDPQQTGKAENRKSKASSVSVSGSKFDALVGGNWEKLYPSHSEADAALCAMLATKHDCNTALMDAGFRGSNLMRDKWDERRGSETYGQLTIRHATELVHKGASPDHGDVRNPDEPVDWRAAFKSYDQMEQGELQFLISNLIPEGVSFIAGLSSVGKTWFALSVAKALVAGMRFLGSFTVPTPVPVVYLIPESGERAFRGRLARMQLTNAGESFLCRTMHSGPVLGLQSPELLEAVSVLKPVVFLDTAIRFSPADDENSATQNRALTSGMFGLVTAGARGVIALHHRAKAAKDKEMTLENSLRGTGDLGAVADSVYGLECVNEQTLEIRVQCVKARDFEPTNPFHIQGRPSISAKGDFVMLTEPGHNKEQAKEQIEVEQFISAISADLHATYEDLSSKLKISRGSIKKVAVKAGWKKGVGDEVWSQLEKEGLWLPEHVN